jgi:putative Mg2+ transporter-C (MgtC) family protein
MESSIAIGLSITGRVVVAFVLAAAIGYERHFHGRAGAQVYCLVCMAACALTSATGYSASWFDGAVSSTAAMQMVPIGSILSGILTGIGFLGAGIIVKSGLNIRGLTTAASIWSSSAIGILVGIGFYTAAVALTVLFIACMVVVPYLERYLPARSALAVTLRYHDTHYPSDEVVDAFMEKRGLLLQSDSVSVTFGNGKFAMEFMVLAASLTRKHTLSMLADELPQIPHVESFSIARINRA